MLVRNSAGADRSRNNVSIAIIIIKVSEFELVAYICGKTKKAGDTVDNLWRILINFLGI
ncbi:hypothetical protein CAXC1_120046 [Candidatus Xenohaliotis californiensis]|uniref:Uncharacterized protein n=2 Tax=Candidatus Xenohaliotis californiensis TaxID=84677 RepID=A0ABM9N710_9RICK|nr:hypothetical protein CAXC1_120046 [Candidatus Xenohaliotis californiensis]